MPSPEIAIPLTAQEAYDDALETFSDAGFKSGTEACEGYLIVLATLALWEFRQSKLLAPTDATYRRDK